MTRNKVQVLQSHLPVPSVTISLSKPRLTPSLCLSLHTLKARRSENANIDHTAGGETSVMLLGRAAAVHLFSVPTTPTVYMFPSLFHPSLCSSSLLAQEMESWLCGSG